MGKEQARAVKVIKKIRDKQLECLELIEFLRHSKHAEEELGAVSDGVRKVLHKELDKKIIETMTLTDEFCT